MLQFIYTLNLIYYCSRLAKSRISKLAFDDSDTEEVPAKPLSSRKTGRSSVKKLGKVSWAK